MTPSKTLSPELIEKLVRDAYEEGVEDGVEWQQEGRPGIQPMWIDSVARVEVLKSRPPIPGTGQGAGA
jgi:hypothetical protein